MTGKLEGKVAMITGGNSGIGAATAYRLASEGAKILLLARRSKESIEVTDAINNSGGQATYVRCDVGDANSVDSAVHEASEAYGVIDILFNNAGIEGWVGPLVDYPEEIFEKVKQLDLAENKNWIAISAKDGKNIEKLKILIKQRVDSTTKN